MISVATLMSWAALSLMPLPPAIDANVGTCPGYEGAAGCALYPSRVYVNPGIQGEDFRRATLHELGHLFDYQVMTPRARMIFRFFVRDRRAWRAPPNSPHERFAEAYSLCASYSEPVRNQEIYRSGRWFGSYGLLMTDQTKRNVCRLIIATSRGLV